MVKYSVLIPVLPAIEMHENCFFCRKKLLMSDFKLE